MKQQHTPKFDRPTERRKKKINKVAMAITAKNLQCYFIRKHVNAKCEEAKRKKKKRKEQANNKNLELLCR